MDQNRMNSMGYRYVDWLRGYSYVTYQWLGFTLRPRSPSFSMWIVPGTWKEDA